MSRDTTFFFRFAETDVSTNMLVMLAVGEFESG
jgi:hypothetical protein